MQRINAIQLSVIAERACERGIIEVFEEEGAKGYTVIECGGNGPFHLHPAEQAALTDAFQLVKMEVIIQDPEQADRMAERILEDFFQDQPGIVALNEVKVFRSQKF